MSLILVTGASTGLGHATADALAGDGHDVVVHARTPDRVAAPSGAGRWAGAITGDLSETDEIPEVARQAAEFGRFDAVVHNAGTMHAPEAATVNTVAPYVLTALMEKPSTLVYLSSSMHRDGSTDLTRLADGTATYSDTKLWVTALTLALASRWEGTAAHAVDPGWVPTRMGGPAASDDLTAGHGTQTWLATHSTVTPPTGGYWYHQHTQDPHPAARDPRFQERLLGVLRELTGVALG
ncbi:SDR family NAD(P)-dependent oxidoreductase [Streptomyces sp. NPDC059897]|uniref:SDR family NAD(P)-dependent oxidoreductase n=1 Tax=Streptomyces sp. NPDC059897 TaxID=3346994 RepID=UPI00364A1BC5